MREEWQRIELSELVYEACLGTTSRSVDGSGNLTLLKMGSLRGGSIDNSQVETVMAGTVENLHRLTLRPGDLLINTRNTPELVGKVGVWHEDDGRTVPDNNLLIVRFNQMVEPSYMGAQLTFGVPAKRIRGIATGTTSVAAVYWRDLARIEIPVPPLAKQRRIAEILGEMDEQISVSLLRKAKQEMLIDGLRSALLAPKSGWVDVQIGDVGQVVTGATPTSDYFSISRNSLPFITPAEVSVSGAVEDPGRSVHSSAPGVRMLPAGTTLVVCIGFGTGKVGFAAFECCTNQQINAIVSRQGVDPRFLFMSVAERAGQIRARANLQVTPILNKSEFSKIWVSVPDVDTQRQLADRFDAAKDVSRAIDVEIAKLRDLKQAMLDDLLTGRVSTRTGG
ncbi:restriction endonuclease subunit S [Amycolatopsis samaneae]|uniref:Restriction endonuclease subunit S n=1 Tax=Amycolatopsis samaneae TaxID=664691 RepID=A0ABW5GTC4_9PSEU